jgi:hypothetical protein
MVSEGVRRIMPLFFTGSHMGVLPMAFGLLVKSRIVAVSPSRVTIAGDGFRKLFEASS